MKLFLSGIKSKLVTLLSLGTFFICLILVFTATSVSRKAMEREFYSALERDAKIISEDIKTKINSRYTQLNLVSQMIGASDLSHEAIVKILSFTVKSDDSILNMFYSDMNGNAIGVDGNIFSVQKNKDYYKVPLKGENYISDPILDEYLKKVSLFIGIPTYDTNKKQIGILIGTIDGYDLCSDVENIDILGHHPYIINSQVMYVASDDKNMVGSNKFELFNLDDLENGTNTLRYKTKNEDIIVGHDVVENTGWYVIIPMPRQEALANNQRMGITLLVLTLIISMAFAGSRGSKEGLV